MTDFQIMVNKMTNWERHQWAKAGYPGLKESKTKEDFAAKVVEAMPELHKAAMIREWIKWLRGESE